MHRLLGLAAMIAGFLLLATQPAPARDAWGEDRTPAGVGLLAMGLLALTS